MVRFTHISVKELPNILSLGKTIAGNKVVRGDRRCDYQNPSLRSRAGQILKKVEAAIQPVLIEHFKGYRIASKCLAVVPPGESDQPWHCDLDGDTEYHTILVPLSPTDRDAGGTDFDSGVRCCPVRGLIYWFNGDELHRGLAHRGDRPRVFAGIVVVPEGWSGEDLNIMPPAKS